MEILITLSILCYRFIIPIIVITMSLIYVFQNYLSDLFGKTVLQLGQLTLGFFIIFSFVSALQITFIKAPSSWVRENRKKIYALHTIYVICIIMSLIIFYKELTYL